VGHRFEKGDTYIPEMMIAAHAMQVGLEIIRPQMEQEEFKPIAIVILGTVKGDMHDIGKNLVGMFMKGVGFDVIDLGVDVEPSKFVEAINEHDADILCMSALLTTTMLNMTEVIKVLTEAGIRDKVNIMVGGAPITSNFANEIGADSYAADAASAARFAKELVV
jgi:5-methyltetrahydrofolate--homocysteine methyltransferase